MAYKRRFQYVLDYIANFCKKKKPVKMINEYLIDA